MLNREWTERMHEEMIAESGDSGSYLKHGTVVNITAESPMTRYCRSRPHDTSAEQSKLIRPEFKTPNPREVNSTMTPNIALCLG